MQEFRIYRPYQQDKGAASRIQLRYVKRGDSHGKWVVFWEAAQQTGVDKNQNASFAWKDESKKVTMALGKPDIGEIIAVLRGIKPFVGLPPKEGARPRGLYHKNPRGNTTMQFASIENSADYNFRLSAQRDGNDVIAVQHKIGVADAMILLILLEDAVSRMHGWRDDQDILNNE